MALTRTRLASMTEDELQKVLVPLFEAMGFQNVEIHQGNTELGKDLVIWKLGDLGERVNYAVLVKAKTVTGKACHWQSSRYLKRGRGKVSN